MSDDEELLKTPPPKNLLPDKFTTNLRFYSEKRDQLIKKHPEMVGRYCIVANEKIDFFSSSVKSLDEAMVVSKKEFAHANAPFITRFGDFAFNSDSSIFNTPPLVCDDVNTTITFQLPTDLAKNFMWYIQNIKNLESLMNKWCIIHSNKIQVYNIATQLIK